MKNFSLALNKGLNVLVGENNAGKTAVIDAIRIVLDTNSAEWVSLKASDLSTSETELRIQLKFEELSDHQAGVFLEHLTNEKVE